LLYRGYAVVICVRNDYRSSSATWLQVQPSQTHATLYQSEEEHNIVFELC